MRGKPSLLSRDPGAQTRAERKKRAESAFAAGQLPHGPPAELKGMPAARAAWRALMRAHDQLPGELFNGLDRGFLIGYCLAVEARQRAIDLERRLARRFEGENFPGYMPADLKDLLAARAELRMATRFVSDMEKQFYATPKSRGGVSPAPREKTPEEVIADELRDLDRNDWKAEE